MSNYAIGSDGAVSLPSGFNATLNTWSATMTRTTSVTTGYGASVHNRRASNVLDVTGSAGGMPTYWDGADTGTDNGFSPIKHAAAGTTLDDRAGGEITLTVAPLCTINFAAVFSSYAFGVTNDGDSTVTFNFEMNDSAGPTTAWDETP
jgi:hypothetical protein